MKKKISYGIAAGTLALILTGLAGLLAPKADVSSTPPVATATEKAIRTAAADSPTESSKTNVPQATQPCAQVWDTRPLEELSAKLNDALEKAALNGQARAELYGESCLDADGQEQSFSAMQTDFHITLYVDDLNDTQSLGEMIAHILDILLTLPPEEWTSPHPGYLGIRFVDPHGASLRIWKPVEHAFSLRAEGKRGAALFQALHAP